jgi:integrase
MDSDIAGFRPSWAALMATIRFLYPVVPERELVKHHAKPVCELMLDVDLIIERPDSEEALMREVCQCPAARYLLSLPSVRSQRTTAAQLRKISHVVGAWDWHLVDWAAVREPEFDSILSALRATSNKPATFNAARAAFRGVIKQGMLLGLVEHEVYVHCAALVPPRKVDRRSSRGRYVPTLEQDQAVEQIRKMASSRQARTRNLAIFHLAFGLGLRRSELANLTMKSLSLEPDGGGIVSIFGKGERQRTLPLSGEADQALRQWLAERGRRPGPVFCRILKSGKLVLGGGLSDQAVYDVISSASAGGPVPFAPHDCRRTFISDMIEATRDLAIAQRAAGHANPDTTTIYDRRDESAMERAMSELGAHRKSMRGRKKK